MKDRLKFRFDGIAVNPQVSFGGTYQMSASQKLHMSAKALPFYAATSNRRDNHYETPVWIVSFSYNRTRLYELFILETPTGGLHLAKLDVNLGSILRGHNGTPPQTAWEYHLALTRLDYLMAPLLNSDSRRQFLRADRYGKCSWTICSMEVAVQFHDPQHQVVLDSHKSQMKHFAQKPFIVPGETTVLRSHELDLKIYAKDLEMRRRLPIEELPETTRVEAHFKTCRSMLKALGQPTERTAVHTIPFDELLPMLSRLATERIIGGLASPPECKSVTPRGSTRRVIEKAWCPADLHAALHMECEQLSGANASKLRSRVYDYLAGECRSDLPAELKKIANGMPLAALPVEHLEADFADAATMYNLPNEPDPEIVAAFSQLRIS